MLIVAVVALAWILAAVVVVPLLGRFLAGPARPPAAGSPAGSRPVVVPMVVVTGNTVQPLPVR